MCEIDRMKQETEEFRIDFLVENSAESIIAEMKRLAAELGQMTLSAQDLDRHGRVKYSTVARQFGGLWSALKAAGLRPGRCKRASDEELLEILRELWRVTQRERGKRPSSMDLIRYGAPVSPATVIKRFGSWRLALLKAAGKNAAKGSARKKPAVKKASSKVLPVTMRFMVLKRDRYRCQMCGRSGVELEVDHITPLCQGGDSRLDNLQTLCRDCNRGKGGRMQ